MTIFYVPQIGSKARIGCQHWPYQGVLWELRLDGCNTLVATSTDKAPLERMTDRYRLELGTAYNEARDGA